MKQLDFQTQDLRLATAPNGIDSLSQTEFPAQKLHSAPRGGLI
jgi:hypothetical protein